MDQIICKSEKSLITKNLSLLLKSLPFHRCSYTNEISASMICFYLFHSQIFSHFSSLSSWQQITIFHKFSLFLSKTVSSTSSTVMETMVKMIINNSCFLKKLMKHFFLFLFLCFPVYLHSLLS